MRNKEDKNNFRYVSLRFSCPKSFYWQETTAWKLSVSLFWPSYVSGADASPSVQRDIASQPSTSAGRWAVSKVEVPICPRESIQSNTQENALNKYNGVLLRFQEIVFQHLKHLLSLVHAHIGWSERRLIGHWLTRVRETRNGAQWKPLSQSIT
jgi:hypothetical protein